MLGWIIAEKGATNLGDGTQEFITANKFGGVGGSIANTGTGQLLSANNLLDVADVTTSQQNLNLEPGVDIVAIGGNISDLINDSGYITSQTDDQTASEVNITDSGNNYTGTNAELAFAEVADSLAVKANIDPTRS